MIISICWSHLVTSKESSNPIFFSVRPCFHHSCGTWNEQPSSIKPWFVRIILKKFVKGGIIPFAFRSGVGNTPIPQQSIRHCTLYYWAVTVSHLCFLPGFLCIISPFPPGKNSTNFLQHRAEGENRMEEDFQGRGEEKGKRELEGKRGTRRLGMKEKRGWLTLSCIGDLQTHISKCSERK